MSFLALDRFLTHSMVNIMTLFRFIILAIVFVTYTNIALADNKVVVIPLNTSSSDTIGKTSVLSISGNGVRKYRHDDSTIIDMNSVGGAIIKRGAVAGRKNVLLPITYMSASFDTRTRITALEITYSCSTGAESISAILLRRGYGSCSSTSCYSSLLHHTSDLTCTVGTCIRQIVVNDQDYMYFQNQSLYLTLELSFSSADSLIEIGGVRLYMEHLE